MQCPVCSYGVAETFATQFHTIGKCGNAACGHLFAIGQSTKSGIHEHDESVIGMYAARNRVLADKLVDLGVLWPGCRVLDIGSGLGHIMRAVRERVPNSSITCVEAAAKSVDHLRSNDFEVVEDFKLLAGTGPYDAIFMIEVIEHLDDPLAVLRLCHSLLASGGFIFLTTPGGELRSGSHATDAYRIPEHVQFFTQRSLTLAAKYAGLDSIKFLEMREFYAGSSNQLMKWIKDSLRIARNWLMGRHHLVVLLRG
jgi:2-polyprenyl-3-methyl-5-hydroxy-6-metoxy-1,4-benzoquinol methylase